MQAVESWQEPSFRRKIKLPYGSWVNTDDNDDRVFSYVCVRFVIGAILVRRSVCTNSETTDERREG